MTRLIDSQIPDKPNRNVDSIGTGWRSRLLMTKGCDPHPLPALANAIAAFTHAPEWSGVLAYDEFADAMTIRSIACALGWRPPVSVPLDG